MKQEHISNSLQPNLKTSTIIWRLLKFQRPYPGQTLLSVLLGFATIGASVGLMATSGYLISKAALHPITILLIWVPIVGVRFFGLSRAAFRYGERYLSHDLTFRILKQMRVWLYAKIEPLVPWLWQSRQSGDVMAAVVGDIDTLQNLYLRGLAPLAVALLIMILTAAILWSFNFWSAVTFVLLYLLAGIGVPWLSHQFSAKAGAELVRSKSRLHTRLTDTMAGMADIISFGQVKKWLHHYEEEQSAFNRQQVRLTNIEGLSSALLLGLNHLAMWGVLWIGAAAVSLGQVKGVVLAAMMLAALSAFEALMPIPTAFQQIGECVEAGRRIFALADERSPLLDGESLHHPASADVSLNHVHFRYPNQAENVLTDITFTLPEGKHIAVVGASGAGKSTLINLIMRLWQPSAGSIQLGGVDVEGLTAEEVRANFALVEQSAHLFHDTVAGNLRLGKIDATDAQMEAAAEQAQIDGLLRTLPQGYQTVVGEFGTRFSGGEKQRLALARALLKEAPVLLLDEPTNGLDALTERQFLSVLKGVAKDKSLLLITHRLTGLEAFDEILVFDAGRIVERGTHEELIGKRGVYRAMWEVETDRLHVDTIQSSR
ncbi:thiol reductant ABC exporter subunit CydC [Alicyclobacillus sp. SO9]|uniref:thiol reductant ABC exporter subunit CydC n=1 Tax=Alicyclobacillus sp. SO9 TaxID=2665646 RepID=UPI0018E85129|nr:thiol reductant ABC exporter subunit CydC [Alicyclobacillus sp. SO9]QQE78665.1 thiol reductant ABC exporter subunit CydC [Alicyclobacillus sp. SO9]